MWKKTNLSTLCLLFPLIAVYKIKILFKTIDLKNQDTLPFIAVAIRLTLLGKSNLFVNYEATES